MSGTISRVFRLAVVLILLSPSIVLARIRLPGIGDIDHIVGLEDILAGIPGLGGGQYEPALTTSLDDSVTEVPFLDDYNPTDFHRLDSIPGTPGRYNLTPGLWTIGVESYCLHAGTHGPSGGRGYLYAPFKGPRALVIRHILQNAAAHPEIPQNDIQSLIWGILARTKISDMGEGPQRAAVALLTRAEIRGLNGGALGIIPDELWDEVFAHTGVSPAIENAVETEARLRSMLTGGSTYEELESIAVLAGDTTEQDTRQVPEQRWSYHPDGYFVRYDPSGYSYTDIYISMPYACSVVWDELGRITSVEDEKGDMLEIEYNESVPPLTIDNGARAIGYAFQTLRFSQSGQLSGEWDNRGWTMIGVPPEGSHLSVNAPLNYTEKTGYLDWANEHFAQVRRLISLAPESDRRNAYAMDAVEIGLLTHALQQALAGSSADESDTRALELLMETWQYRILAAMNGYSAVPAADGAKDMRRAKGGTQIVDMEDLGFDLSGGDKGGTSAQPGNPGSQMLGISGRGSGGSGEDNKDPYTKGWQQGHWDAFNAAWNTAHEPGATYEEPVPPLVPLVGDPEYIDGYGDGWEQGWKDGWDKGIDDKHNERIKELIDDGFRQMHQP